ncbi:hypothetical protein KR222_008243 [Zaprionus bogoriensis]|nr:hypothetical protein KR222_008243 [Zaprionus bogoriensis]
MLKRKLQQRAPTSSDTKTPKVTELPGASVSNMFSEPFWMQFYANECQLNVELRALEQPASIFCTYNPVEYASELHCAYLRRYLRGRRRVMFVGMNPGPNGMGQTGVPFGNVRSVRDMMQLTGAVQQPPVVHSKRSVQGLQCRIEEPSGVRLWELFERLAGGSLDTFFEQCFVYNFCPLAFFDEAGHNITPSELKGPYKQRIRDLCLHSLDKQLNLVEPQIIIAVGDYVHTALKRSAYCGESVLVLRLPHPSPRALNNTNWAEKAQTFLEQHSIIKFMRNEG